MKSTATAVWNGGLKDGKGKLTGGTAAFTDLAYDFGKRFEGATTPGTTPEELIGAAHAGCYSMALSGGINAAGFTPTSITTKATVTLEPVDGKPTVSSSHLEVTAVVPGMDAAKFAEVAEATKGGCPISRALNTKISLDAKLA
jgi:osmotically inducible protein OsmC